MWKRKKWSDLTQIQKTGIVVVGIIQVALMVAAQWDIQHRPKEKIHGNKWVWRAIATVNFAGPIAYFVIGRSRPGRRRVTLAE